MELDDLQNAINEQPDAAEPYLVYADWLLSQGDVFGEYIQLSHALTHTTDPDRFLRLKTRYEALKKQHLEAWQGGVTLDEASMAAEWRFGFVRKASLRATKFRALLESRTGRFIRDVALTGTATQLDVALTALPPNLRGLSLSVDSMQDAVVLPTLPRTLERLSLEGVKVRIAPMTASTSSPVAPSPLTPFTPSPVEGLRDLRLHLTTDPSIRDLLQHSAATIATLHLRAVPKLTHAILGATPDVELPSLKHLAIEDDLPDEVISGLTESPLLKHLSSLSIGGSISDDGLDSMLKGFDRFSRIHSLILFNATVSRPLRTMAKKQLPQMLILRNKPTELTRW